jgi:hypothetical protein
MVSHVPNPHHGGAPLAGSAAVDPRKTAQTGRRPRRTRQERLLHSNTHSKQKELTMSLNNPFDPHSELTTCSCGHHASQAEHDLAEVDALNQRVIQSTVMRALFPQDAERRRFLRSVGASTAWAAISSLIPFGALEAMAQEKGSLEKKDLKVGFIRSPAPAR